MLRTKYVRSMIVVIIKLYNHIIIQSYDAHTVHETVTVASPPAIATVSVISTGGVGTVNN